MSYINGTIFVNSHVIDLRLDSMEDMWIGHEGFIVAGSVVPDFSKVKFDTTTPQYKSIVTDHPSGIWYTPGCIKNAIDYYEQEVESCKGALNRLDNLTFSVDYYKLDQQQKDDIEKDKLNTNELLKYNKGCMDLACKLYHLLSSFEDLVKFEDSDYYESNEVYLFAYLN